MAASARGVATAVIAGALAGAIATGLMPGAARAQTSGGYSLAPTGPVETVFDWSRDACVKSHVPDAPARAFRNADGEVRLIISHNDNRALLGPSLDAVVPSCAVIYEANRSPKLAAFDDLSWISSVYTGDGRTVYALAHTELRGERTPGQCPAGKYSACLLNTVTGLVSRDGGRSFRPEGEGGPPVVATLPYDFPTDRTARVGYANPTNIIKRDGWYYAFIFADGYRAQKRGACLIRTKNLSDPASWRAWNGRDFSARFVDPFRDEVTDADAHTCTPVATRIIGRMIGGLVTLRDSGEVMAVFGDKRKMPDGRVVEGFFTSTSRDLIEWSEPRLVMAAELLWDKSCDERHAYFYPSLIDPDAKTFSYEDFGERGYLYLTRYQLRNCKVTWDRDLVRVPVELKRGG
ncbi:hypothetical protein Ga0061061_10396 [Chelatococcus sambhunathii]|uniref:Glycosyl hydrolases family 43 n=1 Tax=Chelatococcus sambhunathii TaxID=363953 RepID=A0ABM9U2S9_9HYPH|nr:hypothetical protein [Chelatococcus sambhunathii]CUA86956.1 hypothetical protein Ga0061061_10396 [Chelatococcus sambhunathii]